MKIEALVIINIKILYKAKMFYSDQKENNNNNQKNPKKQNKNKNNKNIIRQRNILLLSPFFLLWIVKFNIFFFLNYVLP